MDGVISGSTDLPPCVALGQNEICERKVWPPLQECNQSPTPSSREPHLIRIGICLSFSVGGTYREESCFFIKMYSLCLKLPTAKKGWEKGMMERWRLWKKLRKVLMGGKWERIKGRMDGPLYYGWAFPACMTNIWMTSNNSQSEALCPYLSTHVSGLEPENSIF